MEYIEGTDDLIKLRNLLQGVSPGLVPDNFQDGVVQLLMKCWDDFERPDEKLHAYKLDRAESLEWDPPTLSFTIERHGATVLGSSRAELQCWTIDLDKRVVSCAPAGYRQLSPNRSPWKADLAAKEIFKLIEKRRKSPRIEWRKDGGIAVLTRNIFPDYEDCCKRTLAGRRKRFYTALDKYLEPLGWIRNQFTYRKKTQ